MKSVEAFTDGACRGNPGPGGWGVVLRSGERVKELSGGEPATTNNRMELEAAIEALDGAARSPAASRSTPIPSYVRSGITEWLPAWRARGWRTADRKPVKNQDLWEALAEPGRRVTRSRGIGSRVTRVIPRTSAPTSSRTSASTRCSRVCAEATRTVVAFGGGCGKIRAARAAH